MEQDWGQQRPYKEAEPMSFAIAVLLTSGLLPQKPGLELPPHHAIITGRIDYGDVAEPSSSRHQIHAIPMTRLNVRENECGMQ
jgi:hypothetical protein